MRQAMVVVGVLALIAGVVVFMIRSNNTGAGTATPTANKNPTPGTPDARDATLLPGPDAEALAALRDELSHAEPVTARSDEQRLAEARAWVDANRDPDRPYNDIEATFLALMDVFSDGEKRSAKWAINMSQMEVEMIRAIDADKDGQVSDDEVQRFIDDKVAMIFNPMEHPYLQEKFDTNGDGQVSPEEMAGFASLMTEGALAGTFERARIEAWDTNNDGRLDEQERVAGEEAAAAKVDEMFQGFQDAGGAGLEMTEEQRAALSPEEIAQMESAAKQMEDAREMMIAQTVAQPLLESMRLDNLEPIDQTELMQDMPKPPDPTVFDADGDGSMSDEELKTQQLAMQEYRAEVERWGAELTAYRLRDQFNHATTQHDTDGDGRLSPEEWDQRIDELIHERDERLFQLSYDLDKSGRVEGDELNQYVEWYRAGSLRADVNYDGAVDARDLEQMAIDFQQQGR